MSGKVISRSLRRARSAQASNDSPEAPSAVELAYQAIKADILSNRLRPGDAVPIERYVKELRLSRTPVREATLRLEREGLIEIRARMGTFVSHLDLRQIRDLYRVRRLLEGEAAREAALRAPIEALEQLRWRLSTFSETGEIDTQGMSETGQRVHQLIVEHCENEQLRRLILSLQDHFTRFRSLSIKLPEKILSSHREHLAILDRLIARDPEGACAIIHQHFDHASQFLLDSLLHGVSPGGPRVTILPR
ncbi:MAG: GntR family transcriptional regulator [Bryobacteraceae bacterium]|nr:GntR family transcriptional regulator [Bryobacteraceae bacterium]